MPIDQYAGYADYSQQDFVDEAQPKDTQGGADVTASGGRNNPRTEADGGQAATSIVWSDAENLADEGVQSEETIANTDADTVKDQVVAAGGDQELAAEVAEVVGPAKGVESYIANLNEQIDKQQNKRKKARLLAFGLALLGGESMGNALHYANQTPFFDDEDLNELLDQRKNLMTGLQNDYLSSQGIDTSSAGATSTSGAGGTIPRDGWSYPKLTATLQKEVRDLQKSYTDKNQAIGRINGLITDIESSGGAEGAVGNAAEYIKKLAGGQNNVSQWKTDFTRLVNSEVVNNLPPGVASDRDIDLIKSGFPTNDWDKKQLVRWLQAYRKITKYVAARDKHRSEYIEGTGRQTGWEGDFNYEGAESTTTSQPASGGDVDLDLSDL